MLDILAKLPKEGSCGRFLPTQLDRVLQDTRYKPSFAMQLMKRAAAVLLVIQSVVTTSFAQQLKAGKKTEQRAKVPQLTGKVRQIKGRVLDYGVTPVAGIKVHSSISGVADTVTDAKGGFVFDLPIGCSDTVVKLKAISTSNEFVIDEESISMSDIANGKKVILYRYRSATLPEVKIKEYKKQLVTHIAGGFARLPEDRDAKGINVSEVKPPVPHTNRSVWQSIVHTFKRKKHVGQ